MNMITELSLANMILREASRFVGLREVKPNTQWDNPQTVGFDAELSNELRSIMRPAPWQEGWAYCAAFAEGIVVSSLRRLGADEAQIRKFSNVHTAHCMTNFRAFKAKGLISTKPVTGSLWIAQNGTTDQGHEGIVIAAQSGSMTTLEANTSNSNKSLPSQEREGDWITNKIRNLNTNGRLVTRGFVSPENILRLIYS
jgi:hypothetical protein